MSQHYDAFISYKHGERDNKIAATIERELEHFRVPAKIQKKVGKKGIQRIFRDRDELPITSDLGDTISEALYNSDYLIVICSTFTKDSIWVEREIEFFLRNHTRKEILTVISEGEPEDVIPSILLYEDRYYYDELGNLQYYRAELEPLSCDYRGSAGKARREELPRLASVLIGCSYDELMNRRRQYTMRRNTIIFAGLLLIALGFGAYMSYSRIRINAAYQESLRNQSRFLAVSSEKAFDEAKRVEALQLALYALPKNTGDKVTPEAVRALTLSTMSYVSYDGSNVDVGWNYSMPGVVSGYKVSEDGKYLVAYDRGNVIIAWDTATHEQIFYNDSSQGTILGLTMYDDTTFLTWTHDAIYLYSVNNNSPVWSVNLDNTNLTDEESVSVYEDQIVYSGYGGKTVILNKKDGTITKEYEIKNTTDSDTLYYDSFKFSPDGQKLAFNAFVDSDENYIGVIDLKTEKTLYSEVIETYIRDFAWGDSEHVVVAYSKGDAVNSRVGNVSVVMKDYSEVECYSAKDMSSLWKNEFVNTDIAEKHGFFALPDTGNIIYWCADVAETYNLKTGQSIRCHNANDAIIDVSDRDHNGDPMYITRSGALGFPMDNLGKDALSLHDTIVDRVSEAIVNSGIYVLQTGSKEIIYYGMSEYDEEWTEMAGGKGFEDVYLNFYLDDKMLAFISEEDGDDILNMIDPASGNEMPRINLTDHDAGYYMHKILGVNGDGLYIALYTLGKTELARVNLSDGTLEKLFEDTTISDTEHSFSMTEKYFTYFAKGEEGDFRVVVYDTESKEKKEFPLEDEVLDYPKMSPVYFPECNKIYFSYMHDVVIDVKTGKTETIALGDGWKGTQTVVAAPDGSGFIVSDNNTIRSISFSGETKFTQVCPGASVRCISFYKDKKGKTESIVVLYNNGTMYRYSYKDGSFQGRTNGSLFQASEERSKMFFDYDSNTLYVQNGNITQVIDTDSWIETACFDGSFGYFAPRDIFLTYSLINDHKYKIGYYKHYTVEDLKQKAEDQLGGAEMSDEKKSEYGLK